MYIYPYRRLDMSLGLQVVEAFRRSRQSGHDSGKVVTSTHRPPLTPGTYPWYSFPLRAESTEKYTDCITLARIELSRGQWQNLRFTVYK